MRRTRLNLIAAGACGLFVALTPGVAGAAPSGALKHVETEGNAALSNSQDVTVSRDGRHVYGAGFSAGSLGVFSRNANTGAITFVEGQSGDGLLGPEEVVISADGANAYASGYGSNSVHAYTRAGNGTLSFLDAEFDGDGAVDGIAEAYGLVEAPGGNHVYATGIADNAVALFHRTDDGSLEWADAFINGLDDVEDMGGPRGIAVSPNGRNVYVASSTSGSVVTFRRFPQTGQLDFVESDNIVSTTSAVKVSPDGKRVYVGSNDGVRTYRRNTNTGALALLGLTMSAGPDDPLTLVRGLATAPAGDHVYASTGNTGGVATLATTANAALSYQEFDLNNDLVGGASATAISNDGRHVYVSGGATGNGKIAAYSGQPKLDLKGKKKQKASRLAVKAECSADCKVTVRGKGLKPASRKLKAGVSKRVRIRFKGATPGGGKVVLKGKAKAGNRLATDKFKVKLK